MLYTSDIGAACEEGYCNRVRIPRQLLLTAEYPRFVYCGNELLYLDSECCTRLIRSMWIFCARTVDGKCESGEFGPVIESEYWVGSNY